VVPANGGGGGGETHSNPPRAQGSVSAPSGRSGGRTRVVPAPVQSGSVTRDISRRQRTEIVPNQDYWHRVGGTRYVHRYYGGAHWYGFYHGSAFYWHRYYNNYWWWHDPYYDRWVYWWNGNWWWPGPAGVYVYVDNSYQPATAAALPPDVPAAPNDGTEPEGTTAASTTGGSWKSPDGKRMVQIAGAKSEVFLYDTSKEPAAFVKFLGSGAESVKFAGGQDGKPLRILVNFKGGSFKMYAADGTPVES
jgi:hypothetical protein